MEWQITLQIPKQDVWFIQHIIECMDGVALMTTGNVKEELGWFELFLHQSTMQEFETLIHALQKEIPLLQITRKEALDGL